MMTGWSFKKEISLADIAAFVSAMLAVIYAYTTLDKRLALLEEARRQDTANQAALDQRMQIMATRIEAELIRLNDKLDRVIERTKR